VVRHRESLCYIISIIWLDADRGGGMDDKQNSDIKDKALFAAWQRMLDYDTVSLTQKNDFRNFRQLVVWLTWLTSLLAVLFVSLSYNYVASEWRWIPDGLKLLLIVLPFLGLAFMNYAGQFAATTTWIEYRKATEMIRAAIYKYRVNVGHLGSESDAEKSQRQIKLIDTINVADQWIIDTKATVPHLREMTTHQILQEIASEAREMQSRVKGAGRSEQVNEYAKQPPIFKFLESVLRFFVELFLSSIRFLVKAFNNILSWIRTVLAIQTPIQSGDKLSSADRTLAMKNLAALDIKDYIQERLIGQRNWYVDRIKKDYLKLRRTRLGIIILSLMVSVISADNNLILMVPVFVALATALSLLANIDMIGRTYVLYQDSAEKLQDKLDHWVAQTDAFRALPANQIQLVEGVETILSVENEEWRKDTVAVQKTNEAAIYRNLQELVQKNQTTLATNSSDYMINNEWINLVPIEYQIDFEQRPASAAAPVSEESPAA